MSLSKALAAILTWALVHNEAAAKNQARSDTSHVFTVTASINDTLTITEYRMTSNTWDSASQPSPVPPRPDSSAFTVFVSSPDTPIDRLPMQAAGTRLWLGIEPSTYCPSSVEEEEECPPGNYTALSNCSMYTLVPGGQQLWATADGEIGYTVAHSQLMPNGSIQCPFVHYLGASYGDLTSNAFGANGLMACPAGEGAWKILLALANANVPLGSINDCIQFNALTLKATHPAAWQYM